jgi:hypothetical protein
LTNANDTASSAQRYIERGWAVVQLHDVAGGLCSCGSADPEHAAAQGGKHPIGKGWQNAGLRTPAAVADAWARRPGANIGIVTGRASGIWVLDVDPLHGGDKQLAALVAAYGPLPETYTVRTGSGGRHYYWAMPDFDFTTSRGQLPIGLDVRGNAGQVVAPPSYTLRGTYGVLVDVSVVAAPAWLLGLIRPPDRAAAEELDRGPFGEAWKMPEAAVGRGAGYAAVAAREVLGQLAAAQPGERNVTAYRIGRRLAELMNSPWAGLDPDAVWLAYLDAAARCDVDGGFSQSEATVVLTRAVRDQGGRGVELPAPDHLGTRTDWVPPPSDFDQAGQGSASNGGSSDVAGQLINGPTELQQQEDPFETAVRYEMGRLMVRAEATRRLAERDQRRTDFALELVTGSALDLLPAAVVLVDGYLDMDTLARVNGPSGHGKSFVTLDFACSVQTGKSWHGCVVTQAEAWYVVGEGARGMRKRERAWCERAGMASGESGVFFLARALQVDGPEWPAFVEHARLRRPGLIVLDTQARMTVGVKENDATEMGVVVDALDQLRQASGACVLLVHHRGLSGEHGRGSTAIKGALDTELDVSRTGPTVTVKVTKQKDQHERSPLLLTMNPLGESIVLVADADTAMVPGSPFTSPRVQLSGQERAAIQIAHSLMAASGGGLTKAEALAHARIAMDLPSTDAVKKMIRRGWDDLIKLGRIKKAAGREAHFWIELDGAEILAANPDKAVENGPEHYEI